RLDVPTGYFNRFDEPNAAKSFIHAKGAPIVVKADGLAAGKGVILCRSTNEAFAAIDHIMTERAYGAAGDEVLRVVSERLGHICRDTDFVARLGGDEFAIIATAVDAGEHIEIMAHRIIDQLNLPVYYQSLALKIGGSVGISIYPDDSEDAIELVQKSDKALYEAKNGGRNTFRFAENKVAKLSLA
ncbi:MAG: diguanylate cyclase, partial [Rhodospirillaceae bacterium]|nr:diguanylate cyclase [Rhodospirillaceae bacterium]